MPIPSHPRRSTLAVLLFGAMACAAQAQPAPTTPALPAPAPASAPAAPASAPQQAAAVSPACSGPEHRQFDFWLGVWDVYGGADGSQRIGGNDIRRVASGCALAEHWTNARGQDGRSLNAYDAAAGGWTQFWIGGDGVVLRLSGSLREDGAMAMEGTLADGKGGVQRQRIVWTPQADGSVTQRWDTSDDAGATWVTAFQGTYRRRVGAGESPEAESQ